MDSREPRHAPRDAGDEVSARRTRRRDRLATIEHAQSLTPLCSPDSLRSTLSRLVQSADAIAGSSNTCDEKCQKRAKAGEVVIVSIVLVVALVSGLACLGSLGTPTKFQTPRGARGAVS